MLISIIVPVYNVEKFVRRCLQSCLNQNLSKDLYEIIVVNDGSIDNSLREVEKVSSRYNNIKLISQNNSGLSVARNVGVENANGEYIMFVDSDDWIADNCLKRIVDLCVKNDLDILSFCAADVVDGVPQKRFSYDSMDVYDGKNLLKTGMMNIPAQHSVYKKSFLKENKLSFFPSIYHEDNEFKPRALYCATRVMNIDEVVYFVYPNPKSITRSVNPKKAFDLLVVCNSLHDFCAKVEDLYKYGFYYNIGLALNSALNETKYMSDPDIEKLNECICKNKHIFLDLKKSKILKYKLEGFLFSLFPK